MTSRSWSKATLRLSIRRLSRALAAWRRPRSTSWLGGTARLRLPGSEALPCLNKGGLLWRGLPDCLLALGVAWLVLVSGGSCVVHDEVAVSLGPGAIRPVCGGPHPLHTGSVSVHCVPGTVHPGPAQPCSMSGDQLGRGEARPGTRGIVARRGTSCRGYVMPRWRGGTRHAHGSMLHGVGGTLATTLQSAPQAPNNASVHLSLNV